MNSWKRFFTMLIKELIQIKRDRRIFILIFIAPVLQIIIFGYAVNMDIKELPTGVIDLNHSYYSNELIDLMNNSKNFRIVKYLDSEATLHESFKMREIKVGLIIPENFSRDIQSGRETEVLVFFDGTDSNTCRLALGYFDLIQKSFEKKIIKDKYKVLEPNDYSRIVIKFNPYLRSVNFMTPGLVGTIILIITMVLSSANLVREIELGTYEQLITTPLKKIEILAAKILPFFVLGYLEVIMVVFVAMILFNISFIGSYWVFLVLTFPFLLSTLGIGLFVSSITSTQRQALFVSVLFMIPNILLSGFLFPIENMPKIIQYITYVIPLRYFLVILRGIFLKGTTFADFYLEVILLSIFGIGTFLASWIFTKKKMG